MLITLKTFKGDKNRKPTNIYRRNDRIRKSSFYSFLTKNWFMKKSIYINIRFKIVGNMIFSLKESQMTHRLYKKGKKVVCNEKKISDQNK